jgi:hypothetical protein
VRGVLATFVAGLATAGAAAEAPLCRISLELEPPVAFVDQQVLYRLGILTRDEVQRVEWLVPPSFPGLRAERLPGRPDAGRATRDGVRYRRREEHRAIYPERTGEIVLPEASLRCYSAAAVSDRRVSPVGLEVRELPAAGRPAHFSGLVGSVMLSRRLQPRDLALGKSARLTLELRGGGNLWDALDPLLGDANFAGVDTFRREPMLEFERGTALFVRRRFTYDLVPRQAGPVELPELRISYFDPVRGVYADSSAPALRLDVATAVRGEPAPPAPRPASATRGLGDLEHGALVWTGLKLALVLGVAAFAATRLRRRAAGEREALAELSRAAAAEATGDGAAASAALAQALRRALAARRPDALRLEPREILSDAGLSPKERTAAELLAVAERARFDPETAPPTRTSVEGAIAGMRRRGRSR